MTAPAGDGPSIAPLGDAALIVSFDGSKERARETVARLVAACERSPLPGVTDLVPAFGVLGVHFDPAAVPCGGGESPFDTVSLWLHERFKHLGAAEPTQPRTVELPVCYDGPDLEEVAATSKLTVEEVIERHSEADYRVGAIGFAPGFAYLESLPPELHTPRRATPRTHVPAGSVAIGEAYTGVYPQDSPGGWNLIGRTTLRLFDESATPTALLNVGDRVQMRRVQAADLPKAPPTPPTSQDKPAGTPILKVLSAGAHSSVQGGGRPGRQAIGVGPGGAMDAASLRLANLLAGAPEDAAAFEATLVGPVLEAMVDVTLGVAGALPPTIPTPSRVRLRRGDRLDLRRLAGGARCYVAVAEGLSPTGSPLAQGDTLATHGEPCTTAPPLNTASPHLSVTGTTTLRFLRGTQADAFAEEDYRRFTQSDYQVSPQSNRMGLRLDGESITTNRKDQIESQPVTHGVIQVPPDGRPVVLGADRQTLGGYPVIGCMITADLPRLGQLRPGDTIRFVEVDLAEAEAARRELERWLAIAAAGIALQSEKR